MTRDPGTAAQLQNARSVLAAEGLGDEDPTRAAAAAGQVLDKLHLHLAPLVGVAGLQALLNRSAKLAQAEFHWLDASAVESSEALRARLDALEPVTAARAAVALFGFFFAVITRFIGERLTAAALREAWPAIDLAPGETLK